MTQQRKGRRRVRVPIPVAGRPNQLGSDKKVVNFAVPFDQWERASKKTQAGRVFNVADFMRLLHKHLLVRVPLKTAQALHRQLIELDENGSEDFDAQRWLKQSAGRAD